MQYSDNLSVREARDLYFAANGFTFSEYAASTFTIGILGLPFRFPNPKSRKRIIPLHDLHHVLTGFATDWIGEAEIGAWELRAGCNTFVAYFLDVSGVVIGLFLSPRRVWRAFRVAKGQHTLYVDAVRYEQILEMSVGEARKRLGIAVGELAS